ncbi:hypothetical protein EV07_0487 [Prochlorococcus sp. MIT 0603]|nr:hypothetical protein EV07_0487 [Prochlorococcus sp. MIT 0603]
MARLGQPNPSPELNKLVRLATGLKGLCLIKLFSPFELFI